MRVTNCPDCGEVVEIPSPSAEGDEVEITCQVCGLSGPASEWQSLAPEDDDSLLGRPLAAATIPASVPKSWALRVEQLEEIRDVVEELTYQVRLLRQALDQLNQDLPQIIKRGVASLPRDGASTSLPEPTVLPEQSIATRLATSSVAGESLAHARPAGMAKSREPKAKRKSATSRANQSGLW